MFTSIRLKAEDFFTKGHERTLKAKKNIAISLLLKGVNIVIGFILIPMTISYVNTTQYGIWLTLSSVISWFSFFDVGLGLGLKNKLAETNALGQKETAKIYISTTYAALTLISAIIFLTFYFLNNFLDWSKILNANNTGIRGLSNLVLIVIGCFCIQFVVQIINTVLTALHAPSKVSFINAIGQLLCLIIIYYLIKKTSGSLLNLVLVLAGIPLIVQLLASTWLYNTSYKTFSPGIKYVNFKYAKKLLSLGGIFFILQIGALVLFQTDNIVITQLFGPKEVTTFNVTYKLFGVFEMIFTIIMTPFWSAFTDAFTKKDFVWIKETFVTMQKYLFILSLIIVLLLAISPFVYRLWLHDKVQVPFSLSLVVSIYIILLCWMTLNCFLLNGIGKIRLQLYLYLVSTLINIPIAIFLGKVIGLIGVPLSNSLVLIFMASILHIQCKKIINNSATGIWNK
jgi:O-antigen/teichoic acid export membrane protein